MGYSSPASNPAAQTPAAAYGCDIQEFLTSGVWTMPAGWTSALVEVLLVGAGGGGGRGTGDGATGGGSGEVVRQEIVLNGNQTVTIGSGGLGKTTPNGIGAAGGTTTFGTRMSAVGGDGGRNDSTPGAGGVKSVAYANMSNGWAIAGSKGGVSSLVNAESSLGFAGYPGNYPHSDNGLGGGGAGGFMGNGGNNGGGSAPANSGAGGGAGSSAPAGNGGSGYAICKAWKLS